MPSDQVERIQNCMKSSRVSDLIAAMHRDGDKYHSFPWPVVNGNDNSVPEPDQNGDSVGPTVDLICKLAAERGSTQLPAACGSSPPGPSPPGPSPSPPGPSPSPPGPSPCHQCQWNSDCPSGQDCYYPSSSASSGCCSAGPPFLGAKKHHDGYCTWEHKCPGHMKEDWWCSHNKGNCHECHGHWCDGNSTMVV